VETFDVGIIGAGIHGASAAFHLTQAGAKPVIIERTVPAGGPTGRSSAICRAYYTNPFLARIARDSIEMFEGFEELTGRDAGFRRTGLLYLHPPGDVADVARSVGKLNELGIETQLLDVDTLAERFPAFDFEGIGVGAYELGAGHSDPSAATSGLFDRAVQLGATPRIGLGVVALEPRRSGGAILGLSDGSRVACDTVLIAAGPWTRPLALQAGADLPLHAERHFVAVYRWAGVEPVPAHGDTAQGYYLRPEGDELFLSGKLLPEPPVDPDHLDESIHDDEAAWVAERLVDRVPHLAAAQVARGWASLYDVSPDWQPVIGEVAPGVFVDAGTSGHGYKLAPALGREVARMVLGEDTDRGLVDFHPSRFDDGRTLDAGYREAHILG